MSGKRRNRVNKEATIIRMFFFKVIFRFNIGITIGQYIRKTLNNLLNFGAGKFGAEPENEAVNSFHGFASLGCILCPIYSMRVDGAATLFYKSGWDNMQDYILVNIFWKKTLPQSLRSFASFGGFAPKGLAGRTDKNGGGR